MPVKNSLNRLKPAALGALTTPLANINPGAIALAAVVAGLCIGASYAWRAWTETGSPSSQKSFSYSASRNDDQDNRLSDIIATLEKVLYKYNIDPIVCTQRTLCSVIKSSTSNVIRGIGTSTEKIIDGITSSKWFVTVISGTAIEDAIRAGRYKLDCIQKYSGCKLKVDNMEQVFESIVRNFV